MSTINHNLLGATDFELGVMPPRQFNINAEQLIIDDASIDNVDLEVFYDCHMRLNLRYSGPRIGGGIFSSLDKHLIKGSNLPDGVDLIPLNTRNSSDRTTEITMVPTREPMLMQFNDNATIIEVIVINGPEIIFADKEIVFEREDFRLIYKEFQNTRELRKQNRTLKKDCIATGTIQLSRNDGAIMLPEDAERAMNHFATFLTFARGGYCGFGNICGRDSKGELSFINLGFTKLDQFKISIGWCDMQIVNSLPKIYTLYTKASTDSSISSVLNTTIEFYRASNVIRESSLEMAIVASHAALETLVPHLLSYKAGWSNSLVGKQISFHDKLRAASKIIGIIGEPYEHLPDLQKHSKSESYIDAYELLSKFRNRIVHQGKPFIYTGRELIEVWNLSQWLCEIFIFFWLEYRGEMNDRRKYTSYRGNMTAVPLPI